MLACQDYTKAIDMWSVGCIFAELLGRKPFFPGEDYISQVRESETGPMHNLFYWLLTTNLPPFLIAADDDLREGESWWTEAPFAAGKPRRLPMTLTRRLRFAYPNPEQIGKPGQKDLDFVSSEKAKR